MTTRRPWLEWSGGPGLLTWQDANRYMREHISRFAQRVQSETEAIRTLITARTGSDGTLPGPLKAVAYRQQELRTSQLVPASQIDLRRGIGVFLRVEGDLTTLSVILPSLSYGQCVHAAIFLQQDSVGGRTITGYSSNVIFADAQTPALSPDAESVTVLHGVVDGTRGVLRVEDVSRYAQ